MPEPGETYDRFVIEERIGSGGMASVYRVRHTVLGSTRALKVLDIPHASIQGRLRNEGRLQSELSHPNIAIVTDIIDVAGDPGLIMEYIPGPSLDTWLRDNRPDRATIDALFRPILDAIAYAHKHNLVHRDLKPGNVLLHNIDGRLVPKVSDFGLAKVLGEEDSGYRPTRTGFAMGTPGYMSPEQIRSAKHVDQRADIFALGAILYELWCGVAPFRGDSIYDMLVAIEAKEYTSPRSIRPDMPDTVEHAIAGCLEPELDKRTPSVDVLIAQLYGDAPAPAHLAAPQLPAVSPQPRPPPAPIVSSKSASTVSGWRSGEAIASPMRPALRGPSSSAVIGWVVLLFVLLAVGSVMTVGLGGIFALLGAASLLDTGF